MIAIFFVFRTSYATFCCCSFFSVAYCRDPVACVACCRDVCYGDAYCRVECYRTACHRVSPYYSAAYLLILFHVMCFRVAFLCPASSLLCYRLSYIRFCCFAGVVCRFCRIASIHNPYLFPFLALFNSFGSVFSVSTKYAMSIETDLDTPSSPMATAISKMLMFPNGPNFGDIGLLYKSVAKSSAAEFVNARPLMYTCFTAHNGGGALQSFVLCLPL